MPYTPPNGGAATFDVQILRGPPQTATVLTVTGALDRSNDDDLRRAIGPWMRRTDHQKPVVVGALPHTSSTSVLVVDLRAALIISSSTYSCFEEVALTRRRVRIVAQSHSAVSRDIRSLDITGISLYADVLSAMLAANPRPVAQWTARGLSAP